MHTSTCFHRTYLSRAAALLLLAGPAVAEAADPKPEIQVDRAAGVVSDRLPYATPFSLAVKLPDGADATLSYWPRGPKRRKVEGLDEASTACTTARDAHKDYLVERQGVTSGAAESGQRKYVFAIDPLRVNVAYCFEIKYTIYSALTAEQRASIAGGIEGALVELLAFNKGVGSTEEEWQQRVQDRYKGSCNDDDLKLAQNREKALPACVLTQELKNKVPGLQKLMVRSEGKQEVEPFTDAFERRIVEHTGLRTLLTETLRKTELYRNLRAHYPVDLAKARSLVPTGDADLASALAAIPENLPDKTCREKIAVAAREAAKLEPPSELKGNLTALKQACEEVSAVPAPINESHLFKELVDDMTQVRRTEHAARPLSLGAPSYEELIPFYVSLDVGGAAVAFRGDSWGIAQYLGVNFYFTAVDRDERLVWRDKGYKAFGGRELLKRLSLTLGITTTGATLRTEDGVSGALGKQFLLYGGGFRLWGGLRVSAGGILYTQSSQNPARAGATSIKTSPFVGLAFDVDLFRWIRKGVSLGK